MRRKPSLEIQEEPQVNLTPLIDVVFVILIMFIVIAPLLDMDKIELAEVSSQQREVGNVQETSPVTVYVYKDNTIWLNGEKLNHEQLIYQLQQLIVRYPKTVPQLFHDKEAFFGTYQFVKSAMEAAGFEQMDVILKPA